jgi:peptide/nickel transport system substrate-binding protein
MRRFGLTLLAATSLLLANVADGANRPRYGGTLHIAIRAAPTSLDPLDSRQSDSPALQNISRLIFDTVIVLDKRGRPQPALASSWQVEPGNQRWQFSVRRGVTFHDGTAVTADSVAASLRAANPKWKVFAEGEAVVIESESAAPNLPAELALAHNGVAKRNGGKLAGSGAFSITRWDPGKTLVLTARDDYWGGRAFLDSIEIEMGKNLRDQMILFDLGRTELIEVATEQARRATTEGRRVESSSPAELMALVFANDRPSPDNLRLRDALRLSIDRSALSNVLLQGGADPAGGLLPNWMTGYGFLFPTDADLSRARLAGGEARQASPWSLYYEAADSAARVVAERIALNARDAGLALQLTNSTNADLRLVRSPLASVDARTALAGLAAALGLRQPTFNGDSAHDLYVAESSLLQTQQLVPLLHLRLAPGVGGTVRNWHTDHEGGWKLQEVWLAAGQP